MNKMEISESSLCLVTDAADSPVAVSRALSELSEVDLVRLNGLARLRARGLPDGTSWSDLLHEALGHRLINRIQIRADASLTRAK
jgi:hypothetical protein